MELGDGAIERVLEHWPVAALSTLGERGPHAVPIVFARAAGALWSPIDGKPKRGGELARIRNIERDPRISLLFSNYDEDWGRLWWLRADGVARICRAAEPEQGSDEAAALAALRRKYPQYARVDLLGRDALLVRIAVTAQRSWCASPTGEAALLANPRGG